jgi:hypothetical protein
MISGGLFRQESNRWPGARLDGDFVFALDVLTEIHYSTTKSGTGRSESQEFFHKPDTDLALILQEQIGVAQRPRHAHYFTGLSINFSLRRAQPLPWPQPRTTDAPRPCLGVECSVILAFKQDLTRLPLFGDLFRQVNFNERLIRNIFFIGQDLELIQHLAGQTKGNRFHRSFDARVKFNFDRLYLEKSKYSVMSCVFQNSRSSCSFLNFGTGLIFFFIHFPLVSTHRARADHANPVSTNGKHYGQKPTAVGFPDA